MASIIDIIFIATIILFVFYYYNAKKCRKEFFVNNEDVDSDDISERIKYYESNKFRYLFDDLPWENTDDEKCPDKYMDSSQLFESGNFRRKPIGWEPEMTIW
jgi:hypothetical protein